MSPPLRRSVLGLALVLAGCRFGASDRAALAGVLSDQAAAWNRGDLDGFLRAYEPSDALIFTSGGGVRRGFAATRERYLQRYGGATETMGQLAFEILDIRPLGGRNGAVVLGRWRLTDTPQSGEGVFTLALVRTPAGWHIVHDHTSSDPPGP